MEKFCGAIPVQAVMCHCVSVCVCVYKNILWQCLVMFLPAFSIDILTLLKKSVAETVLSLKRCTIFSVASVQ